MYKRFRDTLSRANNDSTHDPEARFMEGEYVRVANLDHIQSRNQTPGQLRNYIGTVGRIVTDDMSRQPYQIEGIFLGGDGDEGNNKLAWFRAHNLVLVQATAGLYIGCKVKVKDKERTFDTHAQMAQTLGLTKWRSAELPSDIVVYTVVAIQEEAGKDYVGIRSEDGAEYVVNAVGLIQAPSSPGQSASGSVLGHDEAAALPPLSSPANPPSEEKIQTLVSMGFERPKAEIALAAESGVEEAMLLLLSGGGSAPQMSDAHAVALPCLSSGAQSVADAMKLSQQEHAARVQREKQEDDEFEAALAASLQWADAGSPSVGAETEKHKELQSDEQLEAMLKWPGLVGEGSRGGRPGAACVDSPSKGYQRTVSKGGSPLKNGAAGKLPLLDSDVPSPSSALWMSPQPLKGSRPPSKSLARLPTLDKEPRLFDRELPSPGRAPKLEPLDPTGSSSIGRPQSSGGAVQVDDLDLWPSATGVLSPALYPPMLSKHAPRSGASGNHRGGSTGGRHRGHSGPAPPPGPVPVMGLTPGAAAAGRRSLGASSSAPMLGGPISPSPMGGFGNLKQIGTAWQPHSQGRPLSRAGGSLLMGQRADACRESALKSTFVTRGEFGPQSLRPSTPSFE